MISKRLLKHLMNDQYRRYLSTRVDDIGKSTKTLALRKILQSSELDFVMEAHNGLSAKIVEQTGFKGIWASGLCIAAQWGVRDANEASWTQVLEMVDFMTDSTAIPILVDVDTGYGNFNNARRLVKKLEQIGVAGACVEDKYFPKKNSFVQGRPQPLADITEFCLKLQAMRDTAQDPNFNIVARVEALIAGWGMDEALLRANAYVDAGADAILIHSKQSTVCEIAEFTKKWHNRAPLVVVPTKYYRTSADEFRKIGISLVIWANQNLRSAIQAMQQTSKQIFEEQTLGNVEHKITGMKEIFTLQNQQELLQAEEKYLPLISLYETKPRKNQK